MTNESSRGSDYDRLMDDHVHIDWDATHKLIEDLRKYFRVYQSEIERLLAGLDEAQQAAKTLWPWVWCENIVHQPQYYHEDSECPLIKEWHNRWPWLGEVIE